MKKFTFEVIEEPTGNFNYSLDGGNDPDYHKMVLHLLMGLKQATALSNAVPNNPFKFNFDNIFNTGVTK